MGTIEKLRDGDVYRWLYAEPSPNDRQWGRYHCCSNIAIVEHGCLRDTFWSSGSDGKIFWPIDLPKLKLDFLGNLSDFNKANEYQGNYYDDADIMNLNHSNSPNGNFYLRKGAKRSREKMLESARYKLERAESDERMAADLASRLRIAIARIDSGRIDDVYL